MTNSIRSSSSPVLSRSPTPPAAPSTGSTGTTANASNLPGNSACHHPHRATHQIRLSALRHNYSVISSAASRQQCGVIVVVKADGYGHGAIETALHLADYCGADAFAVATVDEGVTLRKALSHSRMNVNISTNVTGNRNNTAVATVPSSSLNVLHAGGNACPIGSVGNVKRSAKTGNISGDLFQPPSSVEVPHVTASVPSNVGTATGTGLNLCDVSSIGSVPPLTAPVASVVSGGWNLANVPPPAGNATAAAAAATMAHHTLSATPTVATANATAGPVGLVKQARSPNIRILVLGPPTNLPDDFALYQQFNLELMCSGPKMARELMEWVADCDARRIQEVEKAAMYQKSILLEEDNSHQIAKLKGIGQASTLSHVEGIELGKELRQILLKKESLERNAGQVTGGGNIRHGNVTVPGNSIGNSGSGSGGIGTTGGGEGGGPSVDHSKSSSSASSASSRRDSLAPVTAKDAPNIRQQLAPSTQVAAVPLVPFKGIEDAAKASRAREKAAAKVVAHTAGEDDEDETDNDDENDQLLDENDAADKSEKRAIDTASQTTWSEGDAEDSAVISAVSSVTVKNAAAKVASSTMKKGVVPAFARRKIKWHALVDSGMGRLGFKSVEDEDEDGEDDVHEVPLDKLPAPLQAHTKKNAKWMVGPHRDTVSIIKAMSDAEIYGGAPIEFYGMCTHMAEASSDSDYTNEQMTRFKSLLKRVRQAGIAVPTISTDNSAALLTMSLNHFNPMELLVQKNVTNTLGFVRTGGGIFGQRPAFPQLKSVSTLTASVRHVAIIQAGNSVGYDRAYIAPRNVRIATLTIGFADGYPRDLGNGKGKVSIRGALFPIAGNVCMDMLMVDLGPAEDIESIGSRVSVGDRAILWGPEHDGDSEGQIRLQDLAQELKTTQSALTCGLNKVRVQRQYVE